MATATNPPKTQPPTATTQVGTGPIILPRITIQFCTQCKWNLRAAYYAQELLQTFSTSLGEVALLPSTSGTFVIKLYHRGDGTGVSASDQQGEPHLGETPVDSVQLQVQETIIWDRKTDGGFPETKELKNRVRNVVEPGRGLGHTDRALSKAQKVLLGEGKDAEGIAVEKGEVQTKEDCQDCR